jgi:hypothetical protein
MTITVPVAAAGGMPIVGPALEEIMVDNAQNLAPCAEVFTWPLTYPAATLDKSEATLTVRRYRGDQPSIILAEDWRYRDASTIGLLPEVGGLSSAA